MAINPLELPRWQPAPQVDWTPLSRIGEAIGQKRSDDAMAEAVQQSTAGGVIDYNKLGKSLIEIGRPDVGLKMLQLGQQYDQSRQFSEGVRGILGGGGDTSPPRVEAAPYQPPTGARTGGISMLPATDVAPARASVPSTARVVGDEEAMRSGLYETPPNRPVRLVQAPLAPAPPTSPTAAPAPMPGPRSNISRAMPLLIGAVSNPNTPEGMRQVGLELLKQGFAETAPTPKMREARDPAVFQNEVNLERAKRETPEEKGAIENAQTMGKAYATQFMETQKSGRDASKAKGTLNLMEKLTYDPNFYSGFGGETALRANQALVSFGIKDPKAASSAEVFNALANQTILDTTGGSLGNQISNADRDYIASTAAGLSKTPEGNRELISIRRKLNERTTDVARWAREYAAKNNGRLDAGWDAELADRIEKNPLFPQMQAPAETAPRGGAVPQGAAPPPVRVNSPDEARRLPPGTQFLTPDGRLKVR